MVLLASAIGGCTDAGRGPSVPPPPGPPARIVIVAGDGQSGDPGAALPDRVRFEVLDDANQPVAGIAVTINVIAGGGVASSTATTDAGGAISVTWTLGSEAEDQQLEARVNDGITARAHATTCLRVDCSAPPPLNALTLESFDTYDGSGQVVHPDVTEAPGIGAVRWLAITPYPGGRAEFENPSVYDAASGGGWQVPDGVVNPLTQPAPGGYLSDPDIVFDPGSDRLWLYYRQVLDGANQIRLMSSGDGVRWSAPITIVTAPDHQVVSPAVVSGSPGAPWTMWAVNAGSRGCTAATTTVERRTSSDGVHWSAPASVDLAQPDEIIWHIDVAWIAARREYWALYNTYPPGSTCATGALYLATSSDGLHWRTYPSPVARSGILDAFRDIIYRSTFEVDPGAGTVTLWISGAKYTQATGYVWRAATVTEPVNTLFRIISAPAPPRASLPPVGRNLPPPEPDVSPGEMR